MVLSSVGFFFSKVDVSELTFTLHLFKKKKRLREIVGRWEVLIDESFAGRFCRVNL